LNRIYTADTPTGTNTRLKFELLYDENLHSFTQTTLKTNGTTQANLESWLIAFILQSVRRFDQKSSTIAAN